MSLSSRTGILACCMAIMLAGCGFAPAYGPSGSGSLLQNSIAIDEPSTNTEYLLVRYLEERLGRAASAKYGFSYSIGVVEDAIAVTTDNVNVRVNLVGSVDWELNDIEEGELLASGSESGFTSYRAIGSTVAISAAKRDATERLVNILGDQTVAKLLVEVGRLRQ
ncbi:MAG: hypothetical protein OXE85_15880 [Roseovarius sp.]|nr:hypothetical protein [Roseovarius sp.]